MGAIAGRLLGDRCGATGVEYAVAAGVVAVALFAIGTPLRTPLAEVWDRVAVLIQQL